MRVRSFLPPKRNRPLLNITPLIDVMFMLLLFFVLTSVFNEPALTLALPTGNTTDQPEVANITLSLDRNGVLSINGSPGSHAQLSELLAASTDIPRVLLRSDTRVAYGKIFAIVDLLREAGVEELHLAHELQQE